MKKTLLKKVLLIKKPRFYLGIPIILSISSFSFANVSPKALNSIQSVTSKTGTQANVTVTGKVTDHTNGQTLPGVSVKVKGSDVGTVTNIDGVFSIQAPDDATLVFSYVGYNAVEVAVKGKKDLNVSLQVSAQNLNEVIVVGYGTQKRTSVTAAVSTIKAADIAMKPVVNLTNSLVGRASGLIITQGSGEPGIDGSNIQIRGVGSIGGTQPLLIVDGVPRDFSRLDPNSIANISVLKDAAAVAPYGVAGANGVILVTTKQGKLGVPTLSYNGYVGFQNPTRVPTFVSGYQYGLMRNAANINDGIPTPAYTDAQLQKFQDQSDPDVYGNAQPLKDVIKSNRLITYQNLSLSGGSETFKYFSSLAYTHQDGMWDPTYLNKYNGTLNLTANATKTTTVNFSVNSWVEDQHFPSQGAGTIIGQAQRQAPYVPVLYSNGLNSGYIGQSLYGEIYYSGYQFNENPGTHSQFSIDQKLPVKGLSLKGVVSYDIGPDPLFNTQNSLQRISTLPIPFYIVDPSTTPYTYNKGLQGSQSPSFEERYYQTHAFTYQGILSYQRSFGKSDIGFTGVVEARRVKSEQFTAKRIDYSLNIDELDFGGPAPADATNSGSSSGQKQIGYVYRATYAYAKKYLFEASGRYDGSYLFAPGKRFGFFPSFGAGWLLSEEKFMKDKFAWIDNLKIRGSYGQSGAYPRSGGNVLTYQYLSPYNLGGGAVLSGSPTQGISEAQQGNPNITWERAKKSNIGFESSLWKGLLSIEADYFYEKRSNMLITTSSVLPGEYGIGQGLVNAGIMSNHGVDLTLRSSHSFSNDLRLDVTGTFTYAQNKLLQTFENSATYDNPNRRQTGRPLGTQFGYQALGYFTAADFVDPNAATPTLKTGIPKPSFGPVHPGDLQYADLNNDGKVDANDQTVIGRTQTPGIIYGLEPHLTYKNFDLDLLFQGSANTNIQLSNYIVFPFLGSGSASELSFGNTWTPQNPNALYPRITGTPSANNTQTSSWFMRNDAYVRLKSFEVGYTFSNKLLHNKIKSLRIYAAGQNVFTWTPNLKEIVDPENSGADQNYYQQRVLSIGVNASF
jgi:TonB-linked SusC/RagA family outer membrane protein